MRYLSLDVETANVDQASICQIGIVEIVDGTVKTEIDWLIDPEDWFDPFNVSIHGIDESRIADAGTFPQFHEELSSLLNDTIVVHHTAFDKVAIALVCEKYGLEPPAAKWLDSARVVRRVFEEFRRSGYGLSNLATQFGLSFKHHDALEDARVTAQIMERCLAQSETQIQDWVSLQFKKTSTYSGASSNFKGREGDPEGQFFGEIAVFTGTLTSMTRAVAADLAAKEGISSTKGVNAETTMLVVGTQDPKALKGASKSSSHRLAEKKIANGQDIKILTEQDFLNLLRLS